METWWRKIGKIQSKINGRIGKVSDFIIKLKVYYGLNIQTENMKLQ
jgi:hypothetical protein